MRELMKRTAAVALVGVLSAGMLTGCGEENVDGTQIVATVNGTEIPMGVLSLYARQQQAQTEAIYTQYFGMSGNIWNQTADEESGETYGDQAVSGALDQIALMYILKEKAADYGVEITEDDVQAMADAAAAFMSANDEETLEVLSVSEEQVQTLLELQTCQERMYDPIVADTEITFTDEDIQQSAFTYISVSTSGDDLTEDDIAERKEQAQQILDAVKEDPEGDMGEIASGINEDYSALSGTFTTNESDDEDISYTSYPDEVIEALRTLAEGEVYDELIETDSSIYIVRLDAEYDEEATESKRESVTSTKESDFYTETTQQWLEEAELEINEEVLDTLKITDNHTFTLKDTTADEETTEDTEAEDSADSTTTEDTSTEDAEAEDSAAEDAETEDTAAAEDTSAEDAEAEDSAEDAAAEDAAAEDTSAEDAEAEDTADSAAADAEAEDTADDTDAE